MVHWADTQAFIDASKRVSNVKDLEQLISDISSEMGFDFFALVHPVDPTPMDPKHPSSFQGDGG